MSGIVDWVETSIAPGLAGRRTLLDRPRLVHSDRVADDFAAVPPHHIPFFGESGDYFACAGGLGL